MISNIKEQCMEYLSDKFSLELSSINYLIESEHNNSIYVFQTDKLISEYIVDQKEKKDYMFLQRMLNESERKLSIFTNDFEYRANDINWDYHNLNKYHDGIGLLADLYKEHSYNITDHVTKSEIYFNSQFEEVFFQLTVDHTKRGKTNNGSFNAQILEIRIEPLKKHFSRNHIISFNKDTGTISLRFLSRNKDKLAYFDKNISLNGVYIKDLMNPINILCSELNSSKHTIMEVLISFDITNGIASFKEPSLNISSKHLPIISLSSGADFNRNTVFNSIEFRKFFNIFGKDHDIPFPETDSELYLLIENYKLLVY